METIQINSKNGKNASQEVYKRFPNVVPAYVCAFGIVTKYYEDNSMSKLLAEELYTKTVDKGRFIGFETKLIIY